MLVASYYFCSLIYNIQHPNCLIWSVSFCFCCYTSLVMQFTTLICFSWLRALTIIANWSLAHPLQWGKIKNNLFIDFSILPQRSLCLFSWFWRLALFECLIDILVFCRGNFSFYLFVFLNPHQFICESNILLCFFSISLSIFFFWVFSVINSFCIGNILFCFILLYFSASFSDV